ncbi:MAG: hypothetical protein EOO40_02095 [Deltaproteobacteria bacterium]|nr:MAG: hypothetical protein EOO40_02095 [Deltaproteobacteria bacterium]
MTIRRFKRVHEAHKPTENERRAFHLRVRKAIERPGTKLKMLIGASIVYIVCDEKQTWLTVRIQSIHKMCGDGAYSDCYSGFRREDGPFPWPKSFVEAEPERIEMLSNRSFSNVCGLANRRPVRWNPPVGEI